MGKEGNNGLFIPVVPKVFNIVLLFVGSTTLGTLNKFLLADHLCTSIYRSLIPGTNCNFSL